MTVVFPLPLGPRKPKISPFSTRKLTSLTAVKWPKRRTIFCAEIAAFASVGALVATASIPRFQFHVGSHAGKHMSGGIIDANLHAKDLVNAFFTGLHIARQEFGLLVDLFQDTFENSFRKSIDSDFGLLPDLEAAIFGFWNVDAHVDLISLEKSRDRSIGSDEVTRAYIQDLDGRGGRRGDLSLAEAGFVVSVGRFGEVDILATVAVLEFFQVGLRLVVVRFGGSNFLRTVAALQFIQPVLSALLL